MKKQKIWIKPKLYLPKLNIDTDWDKVPNWKDCAPLNPHRQHLAKRKKKELKKAVIWVESPKGKYKVGTKQAKRYAPREQESLYSMAAKHPSVHKALIETRKKGYKVTYATELTKTNVGVGMIYSEGIASGWINRKLKQMEILGEKRQPKYGQKTILHEYKHVKQDPKRVTKEMKKYKYLDRPHEVEARKYAEEKMKERYGEEEEEEE